METHQVIVVGAGIAGLVAAYELRKKGIDVVVLEASSRAGGRMVSDRAEGYLMDGGAQFLSSAYTILPGLIEELGMGAAYLETSRFVGIVRDGRIRKFRYDRPFSLLSGGLLHFREWLAFGAGSFRLPGRSRALPLNDYSAWRAFDDETADSWSDRRFGHAITEYFFEPLLETFYFQSPGETSKALAMALHAFGGHRAKTMTLAGGIAALPERMAERLDIRLKNAVRGISVEGNGVLVRTDDREYRADGVILAAPAPLSGAIYNASAPIERKLLDTAYSTTVTIAFALKSALPGEIGLKGVYGVWIPRKERSVIAAFTIETAKDPGRALSGELVHVMLSGEAGKAMVEEEEARIVATVLKELERYIPGVSSNVAFTKLYRWRHAEPKSPVGRCSNIEEYRRSIRPECRVVLAGDYMGMPFTEGAAETGYWAASFLLNGDIF